MGHDFFCAICHLYLTTLTIFNTPRNIYLRSFQNQDDDPPQDPTDNEHDQDNEEIDGNEINHDLQEMRSWEFDDFEDTDEPDMHSKFFRHDKSPERNSNEIDVEDITRETFNIVRFTRDEILSNFISLKLKRNLSDRVLEEIFYVLNKGLDKDTLENDLPDNKCTLASTLKRSTSFTWEYVIFCPDCHNIVRKESEKLNEAICKVCNSDIGKSHLQRHRGRFIILPIRKQINNYLKNKDFVSVLRVFHGMKYGKLNGKVHQHLFKNLDFSLYLGVDSANLSTDGSITIFPAVIFFQNVPFSLQHRFVRSTSSLIIKFQMNAVLRECDAFRMSANDSHSSLTIICNIGNTNIAEIDECKISRNRKSRRSIANETSYI